MDYSWLFIGAMAGLLFGTIFIMVGFIAGGKNGTDKRHNNDVPDGDFDIRVYVPCRDRDRSGNRSDNPQVDEVISVLDTLYVGASSTEKAAIDYAKECIDIAHKLAKYFKGETE